MNCNWADLIEDVIVGKLTEALLGDGYRIEMSDQDGGGLYVYAYPDNAATNKLATHWVRLVRGNGPDVVSDYSTNLEDTLKDLNAFTEIFR